MAKAKASKVSKAKAAPVVYAYYDVNALYTSDAVGIFLTKPEGGECSECGGPTGASIDDADANMCKAAATKLGLKAGKLYKLTIKVEEVSA